MSLGPHGIDAILAAHPSKTTAELADELVATHVRGARTVLGADAPVEGHFSSEDGVVLSLVLVARDTVRDPRRELPRALLLASGDAFEGVTDGEELEFRLPGRWSRDDGFAEMRRLLGEAWAWNLDPSELWKARACAESSLVFHYLPLRPFAEGTLGHLLERGGLWTVGAVGEHDDVALRIESATLDITFADLGAERVVFGFRLHVAAPWGEEQLDATHENMLAHCRVWLDTPVSVAQRPRVVEALATAVAAIRAPASSPRRVPLESLLEATLAQPMAGSLAAWARDTFDPVAFEPVYVEHEGRRIEARVVEHRPPRVSLRAELEGWARIEVLDGAGPAPTSAWLPLGMLEADGVVRDGPRSEAELAHVARITVAFREELAAFLRALLATGALGELAARLDPYWTFWPLTMIDFALRRGLPPPIPVPPIDPDDPSRGAELRRTSAERLASLASSDPRARDEPLARIFAAYEIEDHVITLSDVRVGAPLTYVTIQLHAPGLDAPITIMESDEMAPARRVVLDGDGFAFRRFLEWLRAAIARAELDERVPFLGRDHIASDTDPGRPTSISVLEWLRFGLPDSDDARLVDFRCQHYVVWPEPPVHLRPAYRRRLAERDIPAWRRFLRRCVDPRLPSEPADPTNSRQHPSG